MTQKMIETLKSARDWVRHWQEDVECNLKPTPSSLAELLAKINATLASETEVVSTTQIDHEGEHVERVIPKVPPAWPHMNVKGEWEDQEPTP